MRKKIFGDRIWFEKGQVPAKISTKPEFALAPIISRFWEKLHSQDCLSRFFSCLPNWEEGGYFNIMGSVYLNPTSTLPAGQFCSLRALEAFSQYTEFQN
jgi:hypothetical protein